MLGSEESSSSDNEQSREKRRRRVPVMEPCVKVKAKQRGIIINLSSTLVDMQ